MTPTCPTPKYSPRTVTNPTSNGATTSSRASRTPHPYYGRTRPGSRRCSAASSWPCSSPPSSNDRSAPPWQPRPWTTSRSTPSSATAQPPQPSGSWRSSPTSPATNCTTTASSSRPSNPNSAPSSNKFLTYSASRPPPTRSTGNCPDNPREMCGTSDRCASSVGIADDVPCSLPVLALRWMWPLSASVCPDMADLSGESPELV